MFPGTLREAMNGQQRPLDLLVMCAVMLVLSLLGLVGALSRRLFGDIDGLLLIAVCLTMVLIFGGLTVVLAREQGWLGKRGKDAPSAPPRPTGK